MTDFLESNSLDPVAINTVLTGTIFDSRLHHLPTIGSTNTHALEQSKQNAPHGSFYVADEQTAGRGRSDHSWQSNAGQGLYLSVLLRPEIAIADLIWLPLLAGLAAHRAIREVTALNVDLRWPNDLLIGSRKTGGILVEAQTDSGRATTAVNTAVLGIGINLHQQSFPSDLATAATSLDLETGRVASRQQLLIALLQALHEEIGALSSQTAPSSIPARIAAISTWVQGRRVEVHGPQPCTGITDGLDARGFLRVRTAAGLVTVTTGGIRDARD
ncbi:MAG TPA: biotin--[acetyl-CoA-carboxylase] ligase [Acidobacteriaceae bacterium]|nr:biotin--[acetyl-CoA-carboxylase] ligase [Acidobacteriaceae bacterium]